MAYLVNIIHHIEENLTVSIHGKYHTRHEINGIRFLTEKACSSACSNDILYICSDHTVSKSLPQNLIIVAPDACTFSPGMLYITENIDIMDVFNAAQEVIQKALTVKMYREKLFHALHSDVGLKGLTDVAYDFLKNPISICDSSFTLLSASPSLNDDRNLIQKNGRFYLKEKYFQDMEDRNIVQHLYSSTTPYLTTVSDLNYKFVFESIRINHAVVGYICVRGTVRDFTEDDLEFIDVLSQMISIELQKDSSFSHPTGLKYEYFLTGLLDGHFDRNEYILKHFDQLGRSQMPYYNIIILEFLNANYLQFNLKNYYDQILTIFPNCMVATFHGKLTILLPSITQKAFTEHEEKRFLAFLQLNQLRAFISYPYKELSKSSLYYKQVDDLCSFHPHLSLSDSAWFVYFETYFLEQAFYHCKDQAVLYASIHPDILQLLKHDQHSKNDYLNTLRIYLSHNRNAAEAAKELHIHKSIFFYRLNKMEELFGIDINDTKKLFAYDYSLRILEYLA